MVILNIKKTLKLNRFNQTISLKHLSNYLSYIMYQYMHMIIQYRKLFFYLKTVKDEPIEGFVNNIQIRNNKSSEKFQTRFSKRLREQN
jgi:hypothetical protein